MAFCVYHKNGKITESVSIGSFSEIPIPVETQEWVDPDAYWIDENDDPQLRESQNIVSDGATLSGVKAPALVRILGSGDHEVTSETVELEIEAPGTYQVVVQSDDPRYLDETIEVVIE